MALVDLDAIARLAAEQVADRVLRELPEIVRRELAARTEALQPLSAILGISTRAAAKRIARDPGLRALGVTQAANRPLLFRSSAVIAYLDQKAGR
ncbi:MAG: hypothetical protein ACHQWU_12205 [Gemmatimonadales bacterium]